MAESWFLSAPDDRSPNPGSGRCCVTGFRCISLRSSSQSHQLVGAQCQYAKHQLAHHLDGAFHHDVPAAELVLEPGVAALGDGAFPVTDRVGRFELVFDAAARIVVDQGNVTQAAGMLLHFHIAVGGIHHIVETGDPLCAHQGKGTAARLSCTDADDSSAEIGTPQSAVSRWSL